MTRIGIASDQRHRPYMEDRAAVGPVAGGFLVGVFDGHGGRRVAEHAAVRALAEFERAVGDAPRPDAAWREVFARLDLDATGCGSTATVLFVRDRELTAAWAGDSRALLVSGGGWRILTPDHRIDRADERKRVVEAGARIIAPYVMDPTLDRGLMVTRALGDRELRRVGITAEPEVVTVMLQPGDAGFVVATDGLWDVVENAEAAAACRAGEPQAAADRLLALVVERDGADNVTVVVGRF